MAKVRITHEFDYYSEDQEIKIILNASEMYSVLWEIDQELRSKLKYGEDDWLTDDVDTYLQSLRSKIHESGVIDNE